MNKIKPIAFYLPQFYPTKENDIWWEPGFTEWTNVVRSKPLFKGHRQPRLPQELGFYDLRVPETRQRQVQLAKEAGIEGFCYWHYWFGGGVRLLDRVFNEVVSSGTPDFPFCLCWANHSWYAKTWDPNGEDKLLIEQKYLGEDDYIAHFNEMLPAFKDSRYIRINGRLLFGVFAPYDLPDYNRFKYIWNQLAKLHGLEEFEFFAFVQGEQKLAKLPKYTYDSVVYDALADAVPRTNLIVSKFRDVLHMPLHKIKYENYMNIAMEKFRKYSSFIPCIDPDFDHSPRSANRGVIISNSNPSLWGEFCAMVRNMLEERVTPGDSVVFIKAWNEWGEGNYLEPDSDYGKAYIEEMSKIFC